jgi:hypothetical protein
VGAPGVLDQSETAMSTCVAEHPHLLIVTTHGE